METFAKPPKHLLEYRSLFDPGRAMAFPCDAAGRVEIDGLSREALRNYLFARRMVGREYFEPAVLPAGSH
jgi:hypothetical protein